MILKKNSAKKRYTLILKKNHLRQKTVYLDTAIVGCVVPAHCSMRKNTGCQICVRCVRCMCLYMLQHVCCSSCPAAAPVCASLAYRKYSDSLHYSVHCNYWLFPPVSSDLIHTAAGSRHYSTGTIEGPPIRRPMPAFPVPPKGVSNSCVQISVV